MSLSTLTAASLADLLPQIVWMAAPDGGLDYYNQRWTDYTGLTVEQTRDWSWDRVIHPDDLPRTVEAWQRAVRLEAPYEIEYRFRRHDGEYRWFLGRAEALRDTSGEVVRWFGTSTDIDATKQLQLHHHRLQVLTDSSDEFIGFATLDGAAEYVNPAGLALVGLRSLAEAQCYRIADFLLPNDRGSVLTNILRTVRQNGSWEGEFRFRHFVTGQPVPVHYRLYRVDDPTTREPVGFATVSTSQSRRHTVEVTLRERELDFSALADNMPQLAWIADPEGFIYWYNRRWYTYTGTTPAQMEGWGWQSVHDPDVLPFVLENWRGAIASGDVFEMTFPLRGADGVFHPFLTRVVPVRDEQNQIVRWFGTNTELKR